MKIQEARHVAQRPVGIGPADRVDLAALTMAAVLDEIERVLSDPWNDVAADQIRSILNGERP